MSGSYDLRAGHGFNSVIVFLMELVFTRYFKRIHLSAQKLAFKGAGVNDGMNAELPVLGLYLPSLFHFMRFVEYVEQCRKHISALTREVTVSPSICTYPVLLPAYHSFGLLKANM